MRHTIAPLALMICCPPLVMILWYVNTQLEGSLTALFQLFWNYGFFDGLYHIWAPHFFGSLTAWKMLLVFTFLQIVFIKVLPGELYYGPMTPKGNVPTYRANGLKAFGVTMALFIYCSWRGIFSPTIIYDHLGDLLGALNLFSLIFCVFLYLKGRFFPSSSDNGTSGNTIIDLYWGTELYPRVRGIDIKLLTNCRFGMMSWGLILLSYAAKQSQLYGLSNGMALSVALQLVYITKFFVWERGYMCSLDIMHDRAGFYICWGCLVWVPSLYTSPTMYLVHHPYSFPFSLEIALFLLGSLAILMNYWADFQRYRFRSREGECLIWGKPPKMTRASYISEDGTQKEGLLLASGWWGVARHFHYVPEIVGAFLWSVPALFSSILPYLYVIFLVILLVDRAQRDEKRCALKYGKGWEEHKQKVPYKMIPYLF